MVTAGATLGTRSALWLLLRYRFLAVRNQLAHIRNESYLKIGVVAGLGLLFWFGLFVLFLYAFDLLSVNAGPFRPTLVRHILGLFFLAVLLMLAFSNAVISFSNLFRSPEAAFLFSLPIRRDTVFLYKLLESLLFSSWAVFAAGLPLLLAYGIRFEADWYFYPMVLLFMIPFVLLPAAVGALIALLLTAGLPRHGGKGLVILALLLLGFGVYVAASILSGQSATYVFGMDSSVGMILSKLGFTQHFMTPNFWITEGLVGIGEGRGDAFISGAYFLAGLSTSAAFFLALGWFLAGALYSAAYSASSAGEERRRMADRARLERGVQAVFRSQPHIAVLVIKDIKTFLRDPAQWSQVVIFFGILALYIGNLQNFSYPVDDPFYKNLISFLNLGATCMTLATMTSRFIFPQISLEGCRFWILGLLPLARRDIMLSKFYFSVGGSLVLTTSLVLLSNYILASSGFVLLIQLTTGVLISIGLSGLSVGMGALFPSFGERNPSRIVSGFGGTLTLILSIALVLFTIVSEGLACHWCLVPQLAHAAAGPEYSLSPVIAAVVLAMAAANAAAAYIPMKLGLRALEKVEF
jgi:ABC-2 type transport system permease protein